MRREERQGKSALSIPEEGYPPGSDDWTIRPLRHAPRPTWDFERHAEVDLHHWNVLHTWGFCVHLQAPTETSRRRKGPKTQLRVTAQIAGNRPKHH